MMQVDQAIRRVRRDVVLVWVMHSVLAVAVIAALVGGAAIGVPPILLAAIPCILWIALAVNGVRETPQCPPVALADRLREARRG